MKYSAAKKFILHKLAQELDPKLTYHGIHHTLDVLKVTIDLCEKEGISEKDTLLLRTAALYHDSGFTVTSVNHEEIGCQIARENLPRFGYIKEDIEKICGMIMSTKIPQSPKTSLEEILADADLDYLGRDDFESIGETLFLELQNYNIIKTTEQWNKIQVKFLEAHSFFTATNKKNRSPKKSEHLDNLKKIVALTE